MSVLKKLQITDDRLRIRMTCTIERDGLDLTEGEEYPVAEIVPLSSRRPRSMTSPGVFIETEKGRLFLFADEYEAVVS